MSIFDEKGKTLAAFRSTIRLSEGMLDDMILKTEPQMRAVKALSEYKNIMKDGVAIMDKFQIKLNNYKNALSRLHEALQEAKDNASLIIRDGVIQRFEFTTELAWKTIREYLIANEVSDVNTPKNVMKSAFSADIISDENGWLTILHDRNSTSHIYSEDEANEIYNRIASNHIKLFDELLSKLSIM